MVLSLGSLTLDRPGWPNPGVSRAISLPCCRSMLSLSLNALRMGMPQLCSWLTSSRRSVFLSRSCFSTSITAKSSSSAHASTSSSSLTRASEDTTLNTCCTLVAAFNVFGGDITACCFHISDSFFNVTTAATPWEGVLTPWEGVLSSPLGVAPTPAPASPSAEARAGDPAPEDSTSLLASYMRGSASASHSLCCSSVWTGCESRVLKLRTESLKLWTEGRVGEKGDPANGSDSPMNDRFDRFPKSSSERIPSSIALVSSSFCGYVLR
mmetsp:Transcript_31266/g.68309  ORF Transcript_31266/g.68309 Transcript_31266/m.68309 type:complete len:267 (-) Transcript_31266:2071-2871(-)